tara:strand:- start:38 stop:2392 length:2355 start_codon:yes stop_codon:yes gene_type:complete
MRKQNLAYLFTVLSVLINIIFYSFGLYDSLEQNLYDFRFQLRGPLSGDKLYNQYNQLKDRYNELDNKAIKKKYTEDNDIVIIGLDQASYTNIGRFYPYDRGLIWAKVVDNLVDANISVIAFDIMFDNETVSDSIFLQSIHNAKNKGIEVILAANNLIETGIAGQSFSLIKPSNQIIKNRDAKLGLVGTISDRDGFIRQYIAYDNRVNDSYQEFYYSLALQSVMSFTKKTPILEKDGLYIGDLFIPFYQNKNTFLINYFGPSSYGRLKTFNTIPVHEILDDGSCYPEEGDCEPILKNHDEIDGFMELFTMDGWNGVNPFAGKIAIIGSALQEHHDIFNTPFNDNGEMFGVEIHANVIQQLLDSNNINTPISFLGLDSNINDIIISILIMLCISFLVFFIMKYFNPINSLVITFLIILIWFNISIGAFLNDFLWLLKYFINFTINLPDISESIVLPIVYPISSAILSYGFNLCYKLYTENQDKKFLKTTFGNYISSELVDQMYQNKTIPTLGGEEGYHTVIFSDVASFSSISEELSAPELVELLNEYLTEMTQIILNNGGTIDKYIGDAIVAFYGAPIKVENHEHKAILSIIQMNDKLNQLRKKWSQDNKWSDLIKNMNHRVGINTGNLVTGNMGSSLQMNYTCMGDAVNLAARLESGSKYWGIDAQVSETVVNATKSNFVYRKLGAIRVQGKKESINVYELLCKVEDKTESLNTLLTKFEVARNLYLNQKWDNAIKAFKECSMLEDMSNVYRKTNPSLTYIDICNEFKINPPSKDWDGVYNFKSK